MDDSIQKTPLHVALSQTIHDTCKSKRLIIIVNRLGLFCSYQDLSWIDTGLAKHTVVLDGPHRVPITPSILPGSLIHGAMYNFNHQEHALPDIGGSHDTILMLFQNNGHPLFEQTGNCQIV